jgi:hypothetical protein
MRKYPSNAGPFREALFYEQEEIETICTDVLRSVDLYPSVPEPIRIQRFLEKKFRITPEYGELPDGILGYTKFGTNGAEKVVISRSLSKEDNKTSERRIATTIAHEVGHILFHSDLFKDLFRKSSMRSLFQNSGESPSEKQAILCRDLPGVLEKSSDYDGRWWEHQANRAIGALLMPRCLMKELLTPFLVFKKVLLGLCEQTTLDPAKRDDAVLRLSEVFDVNPIVARIRLEERYPSKKFSRK